MWDSIAKYDVISVDFEDGDDERRVIGEVTNITTDKMVVMDRNGAYHLIERNALIDLDHINRAPREEDKDMYDGTPNGYYLYKN